MKSGDRTKKFFAAAAHYVLGQRSGIKVKGSPQKLRAVQEALNASRVLYEALQDPTTNLDEVLRLVEKKRESSAKFRSTVGIDWVL